MIVGFGDGDSVVNCPAGLADSVVYGPG